MALPHDSTGLPAVYDCGISSSYPLTIFTVSSCDDKEANFIDTFNTTSKYLDDILNINNIYFDKMVSKIY